jgi:hypothetical protein
MRKELDDKLCSDYPKIFADRNGDMRRTSMCWGFECGDGWYPLVAHLCRLLQWDIDKNGHPQVVASQVKEKYGTLCFYVQSADMRQDGMISFAESLSGTICEVCGNPGKPNKSGWIKTRCPQHTEPEDVNEDEEVGDGPAC